MESKQDDITLFDTLFTTNHISMMKLLLPTLPPSGQKNIAIYIKYLELQYTLEYFNHHPRGLLYPRSANTEVSGDFNTVLEKLLPYCTPREKESFSQMRNMMNSFRNMQDMMETINLMKEMFPEGFEGAGEDMSNLFAGGDLSSLLSGMGGMFSGMGGSTGNTSNG